MHGVRAADDLRDRDFSLKVSLEYVKGNSFQAFCFCAALGTLENGVTSRSSPSALKHLANVSGSLSRSMLVPCFSCARVVVFKVRVAVNRGRTAVLSDTVYRVKQNVHAPILAVEQTVQRGNAFFFDTATAFIGTIEKKATNEYASILDDTLTSTAWQIFFVLDSLWASTIVAPHTRRYDSKKALHHCLLRMSC